MQSKDNLKVVITQTNFKRFSSQFSICDKSAGVIFKFFLDFFHDVDNSKGFQNATFFICSLTNLMTDLIFFHMIHLRPFHSLTELIIF